MKTLLIIDGHSIMHRAFYAIPPLTTASGTPTNAIFGFFSMLQKATSEFKPEYVIVCFDTPVKTFRKELYEKYQAHRPKAQDGFIIQIPLIKDLLDKAGVFRIEKPGFEADDVIGTLSHQFGTSDTRVIILSSDRDILQLVNDHVFVVVPKVGISSTVLYDRNAVIEKFGLPPEKIPDLKGLMGDASDNIPGAKGIGPKTAAKLLQEYGSVENLLAELPKMSENNTKLLLVKHEELITLSKKLATIITDLPLEIEQEQTAFQGFQEGMKQSLEDLEIHALIPRLFYGENTKPVEKPSQEKKKKEEKKTDEDQMDLF
ncbi:hypothetical protein HGA88_06300 [Candidatus Roizmanbacteria bacterium]|nr:hypothetical protein [Candidatus Roizmanbacteria bacterium]